MTRALTLSDLLARFADDEETADGWLAACPAHHDSHNSLRIAVSAAGKVLLKDRAGCETAKVLEALGLTLRDLATMTADVTPSRTASSTDVPADGAAIAGLAVKLDRWATALDTASAERAVEYARERFGISLDDARRLGLGYADDLPGGPRLVVPFRDPSGVARGYQARALDPAEDLRWYGPKSPSGASWSKLALLRAVDPAAPLVVTEGPGDALTACAAGFDAVAVRGAALTSDQVVELLAEWASGRDVVIAGDGDDAGRRFSSTLESALSRRGVTVRALDLPNGSDLADRYRDDPDGFGAWLALACEAVDLEAPAAPEEARDALTPTAIVERILSRVEFARTPSGSIVTIPTTPGVPRIASPIGAIGAAVDRWAWAEFRAVLPSSKATSVRRVLEHLAAEAPQRPAPLRVHETPGEVTLDLGTPDGRSVRITAGGWDVVDSDVVFLRTAATRPLPLPVSGGSRDELRVLLDLEVDDPRWRLVWGWLVGAMFAATPRPILFATGPQGSGKSTRARMVKSIMDPADALGHAPGTSERDDTTSAAGRFVPSWDNLSAVDRETSDWLARLVTGAEADRRKLYSDEDLVVTYMRRTGVATAISTPLGLRADVLERLVPVEFDRVPVEERRTEASLWSTFDDAHGRILGALLDDVARVLARSGDAASAGVPLPRMADFASHLIALDLAVGGDPKSQGAFFSTYETAVRDGLSESAEDEPFVAALVRLARSRKGSGFTWAGTATELESALADARPVERDAYWPTGPRQIGAEVMRQSEACRAVGLSVQRVKGSHGVRRIELSWSDATPMPPSMPPAMPPAETPSDQALLDGVASVAYPGYRSPLHALQPPSSGPDIDSII